MLNLCGLLDGPLVFFETMMGVPWMEFLTRLGEPTLERLRALPSQTRVAGISLGLVIAVGLWLLIGRGAPQDYVALWDGRDFSEPQIARISAAFRKHRLEGARISGRSIEIPAAQKGVYLMAVEAENAWPAQFDAPIERALAGANPLMSWQQNRESLQRGEKQMLARIVEEMSGIENAAVQYDEIRHPGFPPRVESRAMVAVKAVGIRHLEPEEVEAIRDTVVAFKSGLEREHVTITDLNACRAYPGSHAPDSSHMSARTLAAAKRLVEDQWRTKLEERLHMYPDLTVSVNAHFADMPSAGRADQPSALALPTPLRLVQVTASIDVPKRYFVNVWRQRYGPGEHEVPQAEQLREIEQEVCDTIARAASAMLPPPAPGWQTPHQVTVTSHDELLAECDPVVRSLWSRPWGWAGIIASILAAGAIVVINQGFRRRAARSRANAANASTAPLAGASNDARQPPTAFGVQPTPCLAELQQQVTKLVQQDPAAASEVLRRWLNRAA
jgi:flagellar biosynthesis/type III secretory pathway M-ring protein FliF/YscJ